MGFRFFWNEFEIWDQQWREIIWKNQKYWQNLERWKNPFTLLDRKSKHSSRLILKWVSHSYSIFVPEYVQKYFLKKFVPDFDDFFCFQEIRFGKSDFQPLHECKQNFFERKSIHILNCKASFPCLICGSQKQWHG